ncbi:DUF2971 domain-containing protein [Iodobacter sp. CM08]|uniref:DUF2971 domain-containing protein n=1 Tax=Iodobacter sp. CM08 TaxID=3085902 RepID=UPI002981AFEE|nr:DUF2971 domain-containing protein [Iodobacter sp. CM08]MDW5417953.1 DUF2971 domain-containing protein [Iodobacter sp. CM08]
MLYKYTRIDEYLKSILLDGYIFGASPHVLNDPYETKLCIKMDGVDIDGYSKYVFEESKFSKSYSPANRMMAKKQFCHLLASNPGKRLEDIEKSFNMHCSKFARIVSLSSDENNPLLWSLYADSHKGVCIEFESDVGLFSLAKPVLYTDSYPVVPVDWRLGGSISLWEKLILTKANFWAYEKESRLALMANEEGQTITDQVLLNTGGSRASRRNKPNGSEYYFGRDKIKSVVLGARVAKDNKNNVCELIEGSGIKLFQAKICRGSYELKYIEI